MSLDAKNKLHHNMLNVKKLAHRMWEGKDVEMIVTAASRAYRNDHVRQPDLSVQRLLGKYGNRFLKDLCGAAAVIAAIDPFFFTQRAVTTPRPTRTRRGNKKGAVAASAVAIIRP